MLKKISVQGFKSIEKQTIELGALNVLVGANGSGKSNLLSALSFFRTSTLGGLDDLVKRQGGANRILHHGKKTTKACFFSCEEDRFSYEQTLIPVAGDSLAVAKEKLTILNSETESSEGGADIDSLEDMLRDEERQYLKERVVQGGMTQEDADEELASYPSAKRHIENWRRYHLHDTSDTSAIKSLCNVDDNRALREDASNLAAYLFWLKNKESHAYQRIVSIVNLVIPYFEDFALAPLRQNERTIQLEWKQKNSDAYFDAYSLSDGSLRFIALTTLLNQPDWAMPSLIVIDEPELGLHPLALRLLVEMLEAASQKTQIIIATQSATLLDDCPIDVVIVVDHDGRGSQFRRLSAEDYAAWLENFSVGELWLKNVFGGRP
ncbi:MAG: AAA family ATPase [Azoarcus sp.]|jgi:predicted ATPase|nr:AAA family ATPase [Azoarcus sp.]